MSDLKTWLTARIKSSPYADKLVEPTPRVAGGGDAILAAFGVSDTKVIYVGTRHGGETVRVGFAAKDRWANEEVEEAVESNGGTMREFLEDEMEADDDLEYDVQHFHEAGWFHFASDLPLGAALATDAGREKVWYYVDGYARAILPIVAHKDE